MSVQKPTRLRLEPLESRRTPATIVNGSTVTFTDTDGDTAEVVLSKNILTVGNVVNVLKFDTGGITGNNSTSQQLQEIDLSGIPGVASVAVFATSKAPGGDGKVNVGWVNDLNDAGTVSISGDLGRITAGDSNAKTPGVRALTVGSIGVQGTATQAAGGTLVSTINGALNKLTVAGDVQTATINVNGGVLGKIGSVAIGGSLLADATATLTGDIVAQGSIGKVTVTGDVTGHGTKSGSIVSYGSIGNVSVGSLTGSGDYSGEIFAIGPIGHVTVTTDVTGGSGTFSGSITTKAGIKGVTIGGNQTGGGGLGSAEILASAGNIGPVKITGDVTGGTGNYSGAINSYDTLVRANVVGGHITSIAVTGDVTGGGGKYSGLLFASDTIGAVSVGSLTGGSGYDSGSVGTANGRIKSVTVHGDVTGGSGTYSGDIFAGGNLGPVAILGNGTSMHGDLTGGGGQFSALIHGLNIASVTIAGNVTGGTIGAAGNIGQVRVAGNWQAASIVAGINPGADGFFGTADDTVAEDATIAGITIGGTVDGTAGVGDHFAFTATHIVAVSINGSKVPLKPGPGNDDITPVPTSTTQDFSLVELKPI
jgi:hypothetical protein